MKISVIVPVRNEEKSIRALLDEICRRNFDVFAGRVCVRRWYKLWLVLRALPVRWGL